MVLFQDFERFLRSWGILFEEVGEGLGCRRICPNVSVLAAKLVAASSNGHETPNATPTLFLLSTT